jgi:hypothetical protein
MRAAFLRLRGRYATSHVRVWLPTPRLIGILISIAKSAVEVDFPAL